jgi:ATPase family associated with various cellular activities (AAA)
MGKVYYDMGFLATAEVEECSATALVGEYIGHTGPKTQKLLEKALGRVLFIDEAYRLAEGQFAKEAMNEIVDCLTKPQFAQKLVVILAGYDEDINRLMAMNPGLTSRFSETVNFRPLKSTECLQLLRQQLRHKKKTLDQKGLKFDIQVLEQSSDTLQTTVLQQFNTLISLAHWGNGRDVKSLAKSIFNQLLKAGGKLKEMVLTEEMIVGALENMANERSHRAKAQLESLGKTIFNQASQLTQAFTLQPATADQIHNTTAIQTQTTVDSQTQNNAEEVKGEESTAGECRDHGVSDETWEQLQRDKKLTDAKEEAYKDLLKEERALEKAVQESEAPETIAQQTEAEGAADDARRLHEEDRLRRELERRKLEEKLEALRRVKEKEKEERRKEAKAQQKLRTMAVCPVGFRWIKQTHGYRCAGGSHWVSNEALGF